MAGDDLETRTKQAQAYLARARELLPAALDVDTVLLCGCTTEALIDYARQYGVDLFVMSTHGRGSFRRLMLGSVADRFVRSGLPTLLVRPLEPMVTAAQARASHSRTSHR